MAQGRQRVLDEPGESTFEPYPLEIDVDLVQADAVDVRDENRCQRGRESRVSIDERLPNRRYDIEQLIRGNHALDLYKVGGSQTCESILELSPPIRVSDEPARGDIEELQDLKELLSGEGSVSPLDLAQPVLREPEPFGELGLSPSPLPAEVSDDPRNLGSLGGFWRRRDHDRRPDIDYSIKISICRY